jgi:hypothetical protein
MREHCEPSVFSHLAQHIGAKSLKPRVPILGDPMIDDLLYCLQAYDTVPRQI